jgi:uncharacterized membrane protein YoaK (UPF0700 family)
MVSDLDTRRLASAVALAAVAGWVDAVAFIVLGGYFVSFMSGNTTRGAVDLWTEGAWWRAAVLVGAFVGGVVAASIGQRLAPARPVTTALAVVTPLLLVTLILGTVFSADELPTLVIGTVLAAAMGAVNVTFARNHSVSFGVTYMTGALVKAAQGAVGALWGERGTGWWRYLVLWGAILAGAIPGALSYGLVGIASLWAPTAAVVALLVVALIRRR